MARGPIVSKAKRKREFGALFLAVSLVAAPMVLWPAAANAAVGLTPVANFTSPTVPGQVAPALFTVTNNSSGPEAVGPVTITDLTLIPSCGSTIPGCPSPDPNVFQLDGPFVGTASPGAVCPASYTAAVINPTTGEIRFTPVGDPPQLDVGEFCRISFTTTTLRVPTIDVLPASGSVETAQIGSASGLAANGATGGGFGFTVATVNRAPATIATQASPNTVFVGDLFSDLATVTGSPAGPTPTGTVTFTLFFDPPGAGPCSGTSTVLGPVPLTPTGPATATAGSGAVSAAAQGTYRFVASYSGDVNYVGAGNACNEPAETVTVYPLPTITVDKTAGPLSRPEPGGSFTFTVVVTNPGQTSMTITSLTDDIYGNIANQGSCTTAIGTVLAANGGTYTCSFPGNFFGNAGDSQTDIVTAIATDPSGRTATDNDDARVTITDVPPTVDVDKTATPLSVPEPGGAFTFNVVVTNTSIEPVTIASLTDNIYGNIATQGSCTTAIGTVLAANGGMYTCSFTGNFTGLAPASQTDIVTAVVVDNDGTTATGNDDATVTLTPVAPTITVNKTASPLSRPEPGGTFTFTVVVTNTSVKPVTVTSLTDNIYGNLNGRGTCATGAVLAANGGTYTCSFPGDFFANAGASQTDVVTATATDSSGNTANDDDDAVVTITDVPPTVDVDKTATPLTRPEPGGAFTFNVVVTNTSIEPVTITSLTDNIYGNIAIQGTCTTAIGTVLAANGGMYTCSFPGNFFGLAPASQTDIVTAVVVDDDGTTATGNDDATVSLTPAPPSITVDKTASPLSRPEPGGTFTFTVVVTNTGTRPVTITSLADNIYGNLNGRGTCATGATLAPNGGTYTCSFPGDFFGNAGASQTDIVTAIAVDPLGQTATDNDDAVVTLTNVPPTITVAKTATPPSRPEPGGAFTFGVTVTNTSFEPVTITSLTDNIYGNIATQGSCTTAVGTVLAPNGGTYTCSFTGNFTGTVGSQTDTVTAVVVDDDGSTGTGAANATVGLTNVPPAIVVIKDAVPASKAAPGGTFAFRVLIRNVSNAGDPITVQSITDNIYGNLSGRPNSNCAFIIGVVVRPGATTGCTFTADFFGPAGASQTDVVTVSVVDDEGSQVTGSDDATVTLTDPSTGSTSSTTSSSTSTSSTSTTTPNTPPTPGTCAGLIPTIVGTNGPDILVGTAGPDVILAGAGTDRIIGNDGDDVICGNDGDDVITGGAGNDRIFGGAGNDRLVGDEGNDTIDGGAATDACDGGPGTDSAVTCEVVSTIP